MKRGLLIGLIAATLASPAFAQVKQSGTITPGHAASWTANGVIQDAGTAGVGALNALGITASGTPFCISDAPITGQYHQLCMGANSLGGGLLSYTAGGGASALPFQFNFNGNSVVFSGGSLTLGKNGTNQGALLIEGLTSGTTTLTTPSIAGTYSFVLPTTAGLANQPLLSGAGSTLTWGSLSGNTTTFGTTSGVLTSGHCAVFDVSGNIIDNGAGCGGSGTVNPGSAGQFAQYPASTNAVSGSSLLSYTGSVVTDVGGLSVTPSNQSVVLSPTGTGTVTIAPATAGTINNEVIGGTTPLVATFTSATVNNNLSVGVAGVSTGQMLVSGASTGTITIKPQNAAGTYNLNLPTTAGTTAQPLISGGGGATAMSWGSLSGNTSEFATVNGSLTNGHCATFDSSGNVIDAGFACSSGSGTVNTGTAGQLPYYATSTNALTSNANLTISAGAFTLGQSGSVIGKLLLAGNSSGTVTIAPQAASGTFNFNIPITAGTSGQPLLSQGGGATAMSWGALSGNTTTFATKAGSWTTGNCVQVDASGNLADNGTPCGSGGSGTVTSSTAGQLGYYPNSNNVIAGNSNVTVATGAGLTTLTVGVVGTNSGVFAIPGSSTGTITLKPQAAAGTYEWDWPTTAGTAGQVLTSQGGAGTAMTWGTTGVAWAGAPKTVAFNATANTRYCIDTVTTGAVTMTLPTTPADGTQIQFIDCKSNFATANLTVAPGGSDKVMGTAASMIVSTNNAAAYLVYSTTLTDWRLN